MENVKKEGVTRDGEHEQHQARFGIEAEPAEVETRAEEVSEEHRMEKDRRIVGDTMSEVMRETRPLLDWVNRADQLIRHTHRSNFKSAEKLGDSEQYKSLFHAASRVTENTKKLKAFSQRFEQEGNPSNLSYDEFTTASRPLLAENEAHLGLIGKNSQELFQFSIILGRKISEFHDGRENDDSTFVKDFQRCIREINDQAKATTRVNHTYQDVVNRLNTHK